jgi:hypothetical protein
MTTWRCGVQTGESFMLRLSTLPRASQACPVAVTRPDTTARADTAAIRKLPERPRIQPRRGDADESRERVIRARLQERPQGERPDRPARDEDAPRRVAPRPEVSRPERPELSEPRPAPRPEREMRPAGERPERPAPEPERPAQ